MPSSNQVVDALVRGHNFTPADASAWVYSTYASVTEIVGWTAQGWTTAHAVAFSKATTTSLGIDEWMDSGLSGPVALEAARAKLTLDAAEEWQDVADDPALGDARAALYIAEGYDIAEVRAQMAVQGGIAALDMLVALKKKP